MPINIRPYDPEQHSYRQIAQLHLALRQWQEQAGENSFRNIEDSQRDLNNISEVYLDKGQFFVAEDQSGGIVGFIGLKRDADARHTGILKRLAVMPEHQGQGIGGRLVGAVVDWAKTAGYKKIKLATGRQERAKGVYERYGFKMIDIDVESDDFLMELVL